MNDADLSHAVVVVVILFFKHLVVVSLAPAATSCSCWDPGVNDDVVIARFMVAEKVLAPTKHHKVSGIVKVLGAVIMIERPYTVVTVDKKVLSLFEDGVMGVCDVMGGDACE